MAQSALNLKVFSCLWPQDGVTYSTPKWSAQGDDPFIDQHFNTSWIDPINSIFFSIQ